MLEEILKSVFAVGREVLGHIFYVWLASDWHRQLVAMLIFLLLAIGGFWYVCLCAH